MYCTAKLCFTSGSTCILRVSVNCFSSVMDSVTNSNTLFFCLRWNCYRRMPAHPHYMGRLDVVSEGVHTHTHIYIIFFHRRNYQWRKREMLQLQSWERPSAFAHAPETAEPEAAARCTRALRPSPAEQNRGRGGGHGRGRGRVGQGAASATPAAGRVTVAADPHRKGRRRGISPSAG